MTLISRDTHRFGDLLAASNCPSFASFAVYELRFSVKEMISKAHVSLALEGHFSWGHGDQALSGEMKPNLVSALIQRGALR
jgi:hypothetical protein